MCRSTRQRPPHGKRCPCQLDPTRRRLANLRQRIGRYERAAKAAGEAGRWDRVEHYADLLDRDTAEYDRAAYPPAAPAEPAVPAEPVPSRAGEYTWDSTIDLSDDELAEHYAERAAADDGAALAAIEDIWARRDELAAQRDAEIAAEQQRRQAEAEQAWQAWQDEPGGDDSSPLTNPAARPSRGLTREQACREEYDTYVYTQWLAAEDECRGHLLNRAGQAKGIDPVTLFSGPNHVAGAYASDELKQWWGRHGRLTYAEWKYQYLGRDSDREAARTAQRSSFGEYIA